MLHTIRTVLRRGWRSPWSKGVIAVLLVFLIALTIRTQLGAPTTSNTAERTTPDRPVVDVITAGQYTRGDTQALIGTVRPAAEVSITTERAGQVTSVPVTLGQTVQAGTLIATLENSAERAALTQAEGAYEAAVAGAAVNAVTVNEAQVGLQRANEQAISSAEQAYATVAALYEDEIDVIVADEGRVYRGVGAVTAADQAAYNQIDEAFASIATHLAQLRQYFAEPTSSELARTSLAEANEAVKDAQLIATEVRQLLSETDRNDQYRPVEAALLNQLATIDRELASTRSALRQAGSGIASAEEALERARLAASGSEASAADAQVKQALGSRQAAQARLAKTIFRTPISGEINSLNVRAGDFVNAYQTIATVANNDALEIVTYLTSRERDQWQVGDTVRIAENGSGVVSAIAPAIDPATGKVEVRISTTDDGIAAGETVRVTRAATSTAAVRGPLLVPLTAVKFSATDGHVLTVNENNTLVATPVSLGAVRGASVEVQRGLSAETPFVRDARGRAAGDIIELATPSPNQSAE